MGLKRVFIGYDARQKMQWEVCAASIQRKAKCPVPVSPIGRIDLMARGLYKRGQRHIRGIDYDLPSEAPVSTDFALARFWVPVLSERAGWALFCDSDFLWRCDVRELMALADPRFAVMVVKHDYHPRDQQKMRGQPQTDYPRKNWSSLILWNLAHAGVSRLSDLDLMSRPGRWLHGFSWLEDKEIGELPEAWNWLDGHSPPTTQPKAVHFTRGTPDMEGWERTLYAPEWMAYASGFARIP